MDRKKILFAAGFIALTITIFITIYLVSQQQDLRQRASESIQTLVECNAQTIACDKQFQDNKALACANKSIVVEELIKRDESPCKGKDRAFVEQQMNEACSNGCSGAPTATPKSQPTATQTPTSSPIPTSAQPTVTGSSNPTSIPTAPPTTTTAPTSLPGTTATPNPTLASTIAPSPTGEPGMSLTPTGILPTDTPSVTPTIVASGDIGTTTIVIAGAVLFILVGGFLLFAL